MQSVCSSGGGLPHEEKQNECQGTFRIIGYFVTRQFAMFDPTGSYGPCKEVQAARATTPGISRPTGPVGKSSHTATPKTRHLARKHVIIPCSSVISTATLFRAQFCSNNNPTGHIFFVRIHNLHKQKS